MSASDKLYVPPRLSTSLVRASLYILVVFAISMGSVLGTGVSLRAFIEGIPSMFRLAAEMWPPDFARRAAIGRALLTTIQIAIAGTSAGLCLSILAGVLASNRQSPSPWLRSVVTMVLAGVRTVPELLWALIFVVSVGPGAFAGVLAICMDTLGFAGRFYAEALDEIDQGPQATLQIHGASRLLVLLGGVFPKAFPSLLHTSLYSLERAVRASVVLGLVGAGGIGIELKVAMELFDYRRASAMVICILAVVVLVEAIGAWLRRRYRVPKLGRF